MSPSSLLRELDLDCAITDRSFSRGLERLRLDAICEESKCNDEQACCWCVVCVVFHLICVPGSVCCFELGCQRLAVWW